MNITRAFLPVGEDGFVRPFGRYNGTDGSYTFNTCIRPGDSYFGIPYDDLVHLEWIEFDDDNKVVHREPEHPRPVLTTEKEVEVRAFWDSIARKK